MIAQIQMRRGTSAEWAAAAPVVLAAGEQGYDSTLKMSKIGDGSTAWVSLPWVNPIQVLTNDPTGDDLYDGRIWIKALAEVAEIDTLAQVGAVISGAAAYGATHTFMSSLNYAPAANILVSKISIRFITNDISNHTVGNDIRVRICADDGANKPDTAVVYGTATITGCPLTNETEFTGTATFTPRVLLLAATRYYFVLDVPTGTGKSFYRTYVLESQPTDDAMSFNSYIESWGILYENYTPSYKIYKIE